MNQEVSIHIDESMKRRIEIALQIAQKAQESLYQVFKNPPIDLDRSYQLQVRALKDIEPVLKKVYDPALLQNIGKIQESLKSFQQSQEPKTITLAGPFLSRYSDITLEHRKEADAAQIEISQSFKALTDQFKILLEEQKKTANKKTRSRGTQKSIVLTKDGYLYLEAHPRTKFFISGGQGFRALQELGKKYIQTKTLAIKVGSASDDSFRRGLKHLNNQIGKKLKLITPLIDIRQGSGCRIHPNYILKMET